MTKSKFCLFQIFLLSFGLFLGTTQAFPQNEVYALKAFKEAIYEDPSLVLSNWQTLDSDPCECSGIVCTVGRDHVIKLNITGASLRGFLAPELYLLSSLEELILHQNSLIGTIPKEIGSLKNLKILDMGGNQLTGPIPPDIGKLESIVKINLQSNGLTGKLPPELGSLKSLEELRVDRNRLQGAVPASNGSDFENSLHRKFSSMEATGLCRSSQLKFVDLSFNFFIGHIPKCLDHFPRSSFQGNCLDDKDPKQRPTVQCAKGGAPTSNGHPVVSTSHHPVEDDLKHQTSSPRPSWLLPLEIVTGVLVGTLLLGVLISAVHKWKSEPFIRNPWKRSASEKGYSTICIDPEILKGVAKFNRQDLEVACEDFSNIIGSSPDSLVYKGTIKGGPEIAVISLCVKEEHWTSYLELYFQKEVADLARLDHENTGKLLGYCRESSPFTRMLVFEYASNGTLYEHLHYGEGCQLSWTRRMRIVIGIAKGLKYLHTELNPPFTISELNSSAVYLTDDFSPKLVDFESWKSILSRSEKNSGSISNEGAICVLPNAMEARHLDIQGNIYAFGILILEIISGRPPYSEDKGYLVDWAKEYLELPETMPSVVDPELNHFKPEDLKVICEVVNICIQASSNSITSMQDLFARLESGVDTSVTAELRASSLAWAELALSS